MVFVALPQVHIGVIINYWEDDLQTLIIIRSDDGLLFSKKPAEYQSYVCMASCGTQDLSVRPMLHAVSDCIPKPSKNSVWRILNATAGARRTAGLTKVVACAKKRWLLHVSYLTGRSRNRSDFPYIAHSSHNKTLNNLMIHHTTKSFIALRIVPNNLQQNQHNRRVIQ